MSKILTICVPTYNRVSELLACLHSIGEALEELTERQREQVVVLVSDNASTDGTEATLASHRADFPWLCCHRNPENIGGEANFYRLIEMSDSEYVWVLGDDDRIKPAAIAAVLARLALGYDLVICNCSSHTQGLAEQRKPRRFALAADREFADPQDVMKTFGIELGYISIQVFRRARFLEVPRLDYQKFAEYGHSFMYGIYASLPPQSRTLLIAEPLVVSQEGTGSFEWYKFFAVGTSLVFDALQAKGYSSASLLAGKHQALRDAVLPHTLVCRRDGRETPHGLFRVLLPHYHRNWLFWVGLPGLLMPGALIRFLDDLIRHPLIRHPCRRQKSVT